jgi:hypothetical protein
MQIFVLEQINSAISLSSTAPGYCFRLMRKNIQEPFPLPLSTGQVNGLWVRVRQRTSTEDARRDDKFTGSLARGVVSEGVAYFQRVYGVSAATEEVGGNP